MSDYTSSSSSSDSDMGQLDLSSEDELEPFIQNEHPKNENYFETIERYNNRQFIEHFRLSRDGVVYISERFKESHYFNYQAGGNGKLSEMQHVLIFLWYAGHQTASFRDVADRFCITLSTLYTIIRKLTYFLSNLSAEVITWPTNEEKLETELYFNNNNFPGVIGCIDGTHIKIDKPEQDPDSYLNRKHFFSIQVSI